MPRNSLKISPRKYFVMRRSPVRVREVAQKVLNADVNIRKYVKMSMLDLI